MAKTGKPTIIDIAKAVSLGKTTVSDILGNRPGYNDKTCRLVREAAAKLGYRPDYNARALRGGRSKSIGVLGMAPGPGCWASQATTRAVEVAARQNGYVSYSAGWDDLDKDKAIKHAEELIHRGVDGIIYYSSVIGPPTQPIKVLSKAQMPVVYVGRAPASARYVVRINRRDAIHELADHLALLGHRRAVFVSSQFELENPNLKIHAYRDVLENAGIALDTTPRWTIDPKSSSPTACYELVRHRLESGDLPDVILAGGDYLAAQVLAACHDESVNVPADVSVVGFDDDPMAGLVRPSLTTIHVPGEEAGEAAFRMLDHVIRSPDVVPDMPQFKCHLVVRQSTGKRRISH